MNTLLRKAAESGGVHPLYIDRISSDFAKRIESLVSENQAKRNPKHFWEMGGLCYPHLIDEKAQNGEVLCPGFLETSQSYTMLSALKAQARARVSPPTFRAPAVPAGGLGPHPTD